MHPDPSPGLPRPGAWATQCSSGSACPWLPADPVPTPRVLGGCRGAPASVCGLWGGIRVSSVLALGPSLSWPSWNHRPLGSKHGAGGRDLVAGLPWPVAEPRTGCPCVGAPAAVGRPTSPSRWVVGLVAATLLDPEVGKCHWPGAAPSTLSCAAPAPRPQASVLLTGRRPRAEPRGHVSGSTRRAARALCPVGSKLRTTAGSAQGRLPRPRQPEWTQELGLRAQGLPSPAPGPGRGGREARPAHAHACGHQQPTARLRVCGELRPPDGGGRLGGQRAFVRRVWGAALLSGMTHGLLVR